MANTAVELIQFRMSHYNEKARWALDFKQVPHSRRTLLPGPHRFVVKRLTGQTKTPVVRFGETAVHGSAHIIDELERRFPSPPLYPEETADRTRALEIQDRLMPVHDALFVEASPGPVKYAASRLGATWSIATG